jgi:large subunit GTPase 1
MGGARNGGKKIQSGLGLSLAKAAEKKAHKSSVRGQDGTHINYSNSTNHTTEIVKKEGLVSVLERDDLEEMMAMAQLSNRDFTAERERYGGPIVVSLGGGGGGEGGESRGTDLNNNNNSNNNVAMKDIDEATREEVESAKLRHSNAARIPRRPAWTKETPVDVLDQNEKNAFLEWRRTLAEIEETEKVRLTPFEKNLEIWKQLWRTCELADCVAQIVDARDPMFYRCEDLERYVKELNEGKECVMVLNKADLLHEELRSAWADKFDEMGVKYLFWSAKAATEKIEQDAILEKRTRALARLEAEERARLREYENASSSDEEGGASSSASSRNEGEHEEDQSSIAATEQLRPPSAMSGWTQATKATLQSPTKGAMTSGKDDGNNTVSQSNHSNNNNGSTDPRARVLNRDELLAELERLAVKSARVTRNDPTLYQDEQLDFPEHRRDRVVVGFVGYPNVGKSSTVNSLIGTKKTGVSSTPGKTKRYQTLDLGPRLTLADAPGLVFPSFASSRADLVCAGVLPVDRLTDVRVPVSKICERIPRKALEFALNCQLPKPALHEDQNRQPTAGELLRAFCAARGWALVHGRPDDSKAGRYLLKMYAEGRLLHCEKPYESYSGKMGDGIGAGAISEETQKALLQLQTKSTTKSATPEVQDLDDLDVADLVADFHARLNGGDMKKPSQRVRPEHKFHKKRKEKRRIKHKGAGENKEVGGQGFLMGKRGGMMPAHLQANVRSAIGDEQ